MFKYDGNNEKLIKACKLANDKDLANHIYKNILEAPNYDYSNAPNTYIAKKFNDFYRESIVTIKVYYPKYRWSKAMGYYSPSNPRVININGYKIKSMSIEQLVSLKWHEKSHAWNASDEKYNVGHGSNDKRGKENTMMYSVNRYVYEYFNYEKPSVIYKKPWYIRLFNKIKWW
jgi:hypothetical protein